MQHKALRPRVKMGVLIAKSLVFALQLKPQAVLQHEVIGQKRLNHPLS